MDMQCSGSGTGTLDVWVPGPTTPQVSTSGLSDLQVSLGADGGWQITGHASGAYAVTVH
jgi:hypothetical protein